MSLQSTLKYIQTLPENKQNKFKLIDIDYFYKSTLLYNIITFINTQYFMHNEKSMKRLLLECQRILLMNDLKEINPQEYKLSMKKNRYHKIKFLKDMKFLMSLKNERKLNYRYEFQTFIPLCDFIDFNKYKNILIIN